MSSKPFAIRRLAGALGAQLDGIDLRRPLSADSTAAVRRALLDHQVIFFRDQPLTPAQFLAFAERFGEPMEYPMMRGLDEHPLIIEVAKLEHETVNFGGVWHSDTAYLERPPMGTLLLARELPAAGGDTLFASQTLAYDALSAAMRAMLDRLAAVNSSAKPAASTTREQRRRERAASGQRVDYTAEHPVVRSHPETGRRALFVNRGHTVRFAGMTEAESAPLLEFLFQHQVQPEFTCRFVWEPGSLAFWDNRAVQHYPINDYHGQRRIMHRITLAGDKP